MHNTTQTALVLQGGGALGAYEVGSITINDNDDPHGPADFSRAAIRRRVGRGYNDAKRQNTTRR